MISKQWLEGCTFTWTDLHGKDLRILVECSYDSLYDEETIVATGYEVATGHYYVLHTETKRNYK